MQTYGRIDVMINNAGLMPQAPLERLKIDEWDRMIDVNIKGVLYGIAAALPHMKRQKAGHFINVSSVAGHKVGPGFAVYAATKHAVRALSEGLRQEVKPYNIRTTVISPGAVATELPDSVTDPDIADESAQILRGRRDPRRLVRARCRLRHQPAGGGGHQRDPVPAHPPGTLNGKQNTARANGSVAQLVGRRKAPAGRDGRCVGARAAAGCRCGGRSRPAARARSAATGSA